MRLLNIAEEFKQNHLKKDQQKAIEEIGIEPKNPGKPKSESLERPK